MANGITPSSPSSRIGWNSGTLIANLDLFQRWQHLQANGNGSDWKWRSGVKHDCVSILELQERNGKLWNKLGERVVIESDYLFPLLKSSEIARGDTKIPNRWLVVTQRNLGDDPVSLATAAPRTWRYLVAHSDWLDRRKSSIYQGRPRFSVFGIGQYTFATWKVAISGFYKHLTFRAIERYRGKPILVDDTCYFIACRTRREMHQMVEMLNSDTAREFFSAFVFWDIKRPITADLLQMLDVKKLAKALSIKTSS